MSGGSPTLRPRSEEGFVDPKRVYSPTMGVVCRKCSIWYSGDLTLSKEGMVLRLRTVEEEEKFRALQLPQVGYTHITSVEYDGLGSVR
jgi:hypothetical protein